MVNYSYSDYFYKNKKKDILVVDVGATVTAVSGEAPTVSDATVEIHTEDLQIETFELEENLCSEDNLKFGLCEAARMSFTIENKATIPGLATNDFDQMLNVYIYFDGDSDTLFQVGQYVCKSDEYSADRQLREVELYDMLYYLYDLDITAWYNKAYSDNGGLPITVYNLRTSLFTWLINEADYPITQETTTLVNDGMSVAKTIDSDYISFGDFMQGLLEANGAFGHIGRTGLFEYKGLVWYDQPSVATITDDFRKPPTQYKDYTTWGVGFVQVYQDDELIMSVGSTNRRHPSNYSIVDNFVFKDIKKQNQGGAILNLALTNLREKITHLRYKPCEVECAGNLCLEVGDKIDVTYDKDGDGVTDTFYTFILERRLKGLNMMLDTYSARGDKKQPKPDIRANYGGSDTTESEGTATSGEGTSGVTLYDSANDRLLMEKMRNAGFRFLAEPVANVVYDRANNEVEITWSDPSDISTQQPHECEWAGTCVIRKENSAPLHRWDGTLIVKSTTRDQYSENAYIDNTIEPNKRYYYAIMPYYIAIDDASNSIAHYTWTKVFSVNTVNFIYAPDITGLQVYDQNVVVTFDIPALDYGSYDYIKVVAKKDSIPTSKTDGVVKDVQESDTGVQFTGLDPDSRYFFVMFASNGISDAVSEPDDCVTGRTPKFTITSIANDGTSFVVNYRINDYSTIGNYNEIKIVAKANGIPVNKTDGYVIDITNNFYESQDSSWSNVDDEVAFIGLPSAEGYGFKIFADDEISNAMVKTITSHASPYEMTALIWFSGAGDVGRPEQDRHYGYIPCYFVTPVSRIDYQVGIWTDEPSKKTGKFYIRDTKSGENLVSQQFEGYRSESPKTFTCQLSEAMNGLKWLVFNDPANSGWNPAVLKLTFYTE